MTLSDALDALFARYGYCFESTRELYMEGVDGSERMAALMERLRESAPDFKLSSVAEVGDYLKQTITRESVSTPTGLPSSNVLSYTLENGDVIVIRPSGTEPKVKFYYLLTAKDQADATQKLNTYIETVRGFI